MHEVVRKKLQGIVYSCCYRKTSIDACLLICIYLHSVTVSEKNCREIDDGHRGESNRSEYSN